MRNSLKSLILENCGVDATQNPIADSKKLAGRKLEGNKFAQTQILPPNWPEMRPEEFSAAQFVELTRLIFQNKGSGTGEELQKKKVWRKQKHGVN